jgi:hypothetical protein
MRKAWRTIGGACALLIGSHAAVAQEPPVLARIIAEGFRHSQVDVHARMLADTIGARITASPADRQARSWATARLREWGLAVHEEAFPFGRGWSIEDAEVRMVAPRLLRLRSVPIAWTPATAGTIEGDVVVASLRTPADLAAWHGKLAGRIVLVSAPEAPQDATAAPFTCWSDDDLRQADHFRPPADDTAWLDTVNRQLAFAVTRDAWLKREGAIAWVRMASASNGSVGGEGYGFRIGHTPALPGVELAAEDYRRTMRLAANGPVRLAIRSDVRFHDEDPNGNNLLADLPGRDAHAGTVMVGAHLDSWAAGDGAADDGAGVAVAMEAARILAALHLPTKRTIRFALWDGEEQGLFGSSAYVAEHLAIRAPEADPDRRLAGPFFSNRTVIGHRPGYGALTAYFNLDNGSGRIRGVYADGNLSAVPILSRWLAPVASMGTAHVIARGNSGSDHDPFAQAGLPAFPLVQDDLDYDSVVHHTNLDTYDHLRVDDLRQAAVVLAFLLVQAADDDVRLPLK